MIRAKIEVVEDVIISFVSILFDDSALLKQIVRYLGGFKVTIEIKLNELTKTRAIVVFFGSRISKSLKNVVDIDYFIFQRIFNSVEIGDVVQKYLRALGFSCSAFPSNNYTLRLSRFQ